MSDQQPFPEPKHDHAACIADAASDAEAICRARGVRLTPQRRRILEIVWTSHKPIGAYEILDILNRDGSRAAPMTVYRALDFLIEQGLVHRIASLNAFLGCHHPGESHTGQFLICRACGQAAEIEDDSIARAIRAGAARTGFAVEDQRVEIEGLCPDCQQQ
jgi:Fur family zinc uptake transcriptional regulator